MSKPVNLENLKFKNFLYETAMSAVKSFKHHCLSTNVASKVEQIDLGRIAGIDIYLTMHFKRDNLKPSKKDN